MSEHKCYLVDRIDDPETGQWYVLPDGQRVRLGDLSPGAIWRSPGRVDGPDRWWVLCPCIGDDVGGGSPWCVDDRWKVIGTAPDLTVTPSIKISTTSPTRGEFTTYHGFLTGGVLRSTPDSPV